MPDVNNAAAPSNAEPIQYDGWDAKGNPTVSGKQQDPPHKQESAPAKPQSGESAAPNSPENAAEPGAAPKQESKGNKLSADERIAQLEATIAKIKQGRGEPTRQATPSAAQQHQAQQQAQAVKAEELKRPVRPKMSEFDGTQGKTLDDYEVALDKYEEDLSDFKAKQNLAEFQQKQLQAQQLTQAQQRALEQAQTFGAKIEEAKKVHADYETVALNPELPIINPSPIFDRCHKSPVGAELLYALATKGAQEIARINALPIDEQFGEIYALEATLKPAETAAAQETTPVQPKPRAPKPPSEVGGRGTPGEDQLIVAARANRFSDFEQEQWRRVKANAK